MAEDVDDWNHCDRESDQYEGKFDESVDDFVESPHRIFYMPIKL
jgi:hypothetical protein